MNKNEQFQVKIWKQADLRAISYFRDDAFFPYLFDRFYKYLSQIITSSRQQFEAQNIP